MRKIAIIGLSSLESLAVRNILEEHRHIIPDNFADFSDIETNLDDYDRFIVSSDQILGHLDFFMPKKSRVIVIANTSCSQSGTFQTIGRNTDLTDIISIFDTLWDNGNDDEKNGELTTREIEVLKELVSGITVKEIADRLCISSSTVITHRKNISAKLGIRSVSGLSLYAVMHGIV